MSNSFFMSFYKLFTLLIIIVVSICCFFIPVIYSDQFSYIFSDSDYIFSDSDYIFVSDSEYIWPTPGYTYITSYFGRRYSPTGGASSYHKGIDIGAPQGSKLIAITSGKITFTRIFWWWRIYYYSN